jgi:hypothetical protein
MANSQRGARLLLPALHKIIRGYARKSRLPKVAKAPASEEDALLPTVCFTGLGAPAAARAAS